jgi:hypothetical protein
MTNLSKEQIELIIQALYYADYDEKLIAIINILKMEKLK